MKNVFLIPTDKLSRLYYDYYMEKYRLGELILAPQKSGMKNYHLYITNLEEIKNGEWCLDKFNQRWKLEDKKLIGFDNRGIKRFSTDNISGHECKKIILTTDQDLIADGVQSIDDEFLEWFVKNPSIDSVEVEELSVKVDLLEYKTINKIIIPREEPKQECTCGVCDYCEEQETIQILKEAKENTLKQETLEEESSEYSKQGMGSTLEEIYSFINFINGAKWQAEKMYSEEEVKMLAFNFYYDMSKKMNVPENLISENRTNFDIWFEQFKKKLI